MSATSRPLILRAAYNKLGNTVLSFGLPKLDTLTNDDIEEFIGCDLNDALREGRITDVSVFEQMSYDELRYENRTVRHALNRFSISASIFFKFSTAVDGKTVDKTKVSTQMRTIIATYDKEWSDYISSKHGARGNIWSRGSSHVHSEFIRSADDAG